MAAATGMEAGLVDRLAAPSKRADLTQYAGAVHLVLLAIDPEADGDTESDPVARPIDIVGGRNWVVTVHDGPLEALVRLDAEREGETRLGALDAGTFVAAVVDEVLADYFEVVEDIEREIDRLDERALRGRPDRGVLSEIVRLRRRIGLIRRIARAPSRRLRGACPAGHRRRRGGRPAVAGPDRPPGPRSWRRSRTCASCCSARSTSRWPGRPRTRTT